MDGTLTQIGKAFSDIGGMDSRPVRRDNKGRFLPGHSPRSPGVSGNAGKTLKRYVSLISHMTITQLEQIATDSTAPALRIAAAKWLLRTASDTRLKSGAAEAGPEIDRLLDRTLGRPKQQLQVEESTRHAHLVELTEENLKTMGEVLDDLNI